MNYLSKYFTYVLSAFVLVGLTAFAFNTTASPTITVQGNLIDTKCYGEATSMGMPEAGYHNDHMVPTGGGEMTEIQNCGTACANMGIPTGIVDGSEIGNKAYVIVAPAGQLADHINKEARVTGKQAWDGGILPEKIEVKENGEWKEVQIQFMM